MLTLTQVENKSAARLAGLYPPVAAAAAALVRNCYNRGVPIIITQGLRTIEEQNELYAQGRTKPGPIVTNARGGRSYHNYGVALDFALLLPDGRSCSWDMQRDGDGDRAKDWTEVAGEAKRLGFEWGGDWKTFKDYSHLQMSFGLTISDYAAGRRPEAAKPGGTAASLQDAASSRQGTTDNHQAATSSLEGSVANHQGAASSPQGSVANHQGAASSPQGSVANHQGAASSPQGSVSNHQGAASSHQGSAANLQGTTSNHQGTAANLLGVDDCPPVTVEINGVTVSGALLIDGASCIPLSAEFIGGISYVPLRAIAKLLGAELRWDTQAKKATMTT